LVIGDSTLLITAMTAHPYRTRTYSGVATDPQRAIQ
jgi:hypothetical protein